MLHTEVDSLAAQLHHVDKFAHGLRYSAKAVEQTCGKCLELLVGAHGVDLAVETQLLAL